MKTRLIIFIILAAVLQTAAQIKLNSFFPGVYYTYGDYRGQNSSSSFAFYLPVLFNDHDYVVFGFDQLTIKNDFWEYEQNMFVGGLIKNLYPVYVKFNYAALGGNYKELYSTSSYSDNTYLLHGALIYNYNLFFFGASFTYLDLTGLNTIVSKQYQFTADWLIDPKISFGLQLQHFDVSDGRRLYSAGLNVFYTINKEFNLDLNFLYGERAFYFNNVLLTIYNQYETQKILGVLRASYKVNPQISLIPSFQFAQYEGYNIMYYSAGLRYHLSLN